VAGEAQTAGAADPAGPDDLLTRAHLRRWRCSRTGAGRMRFFRSDEDLPGGGAAVAAAGWHAAGYELAAARWRRGAWPSCWTASMTGCAAGSRGGGWRPAAAVVGRPGGWSYQLLDDHERRCSGSLVFPGLYAGGRRAVPGKAPGRCAAAGGLFFGQPRGPGPDAGPGMCAGDAACLRAGLLAEAGEDARAPSPGPYAAGGEQRGRAAGRPGGGRGALA